MDICETATARDPADRWAGAAELAAELGVAGRRQRAEEARVVVAEAAAKGPQATTLRILASGLRAEAEACSPMSSPGSPSRPRHRLGQARSSHGTGAAS